MNAEPVTTTTAHLEDKVKLAVRKFINLISGRYDIDQVSVYGSRAREDHREDSDVDVAILLRGNPQRCLTVKLDMMNDACNVLFETGILISPLPVWLSEWNSPANYSNPMLLKNIKREGIRL